jgi:hypothetical protein
LPFLRFTRDKRGYETTSLVHAGRRQGRSKQRILYWFRTPPGVRVGRPALDEEAIRWIEEHNPDIEFDWQKILEAKAPATSPAEDGRNRRIRRDRPESPPVSQQPRPAAPALIADPDSLHVEVQTAKPDAELDVEPDLHVLEPDLDEEPVLAEQEVAEAFTHLAHPDAPQQTSAPGTPLDHTLGREHLTRLRARYAELQARITERGGDAERVDALRREAESLNPDTWVTEEEVRKGLQEFEPRIRDLRGALGLRRRRRSRRGHRGRPESEPPEENKSEG